MQIKVTYLYSTSENLNDNNQLVIRVFNKRLYFFFQFIEIIFSISFS